MKNYLFLYIPVCLLIGYVSLNGQVSPGQSSRVFVKTSSVTWADGLGRHLAAGDAYLQRGQSELALEAYDYAVANWPNMAEPLIKRALAKYHLGRVAAARADYQQAQRISPEVSRLYGFGSAVNRLEVLAFEPDELLQRLIQSPGQAPQEEVVRLLQESMALKSKGEVPRALSDIDRAIRLSDSPDAALYKMKGNLELLLGRHLEAEASYSRAISLAPAFAQAYYNRGLNRLLLYDHSGACADFAQSVQLGYVPEYRTENPWSCPM